MMVQQNKEYARGVDSFVYEGKYTSDGHSVTFSIGPDNRVLIKEMIIRGVNVSNNERQISLSEAIELQKKLRKFGYDKVS